jgi:hypothetical protein
MPARTLPRTFNLTDLVASFSNQAVLAINVVIPSTHENSEMRTVLERCAGTALNSKLIGSHNAFFSKMVVDAVMHLDEDLNIDLIGIKKEKGGSMEVRSSPRLRLLYFDTAGRSAHSCLYARSVLVLSAVDDVTGLAADRRCGFQEVLLVRWFRAAAQEDPQPQDFAAQPRARAEGREGQR